MTEREIKTLQLIAEGGKTYYHVRRLFADINPIAGRREKSFGFAGAAGRCVQKLEKLGLVYESLEYVDGRVHRLELSLTKNGKKMLQSVILERSPK